MLNYKIHTVAYDYANIDEVISDISGNKFLMKYDVSSSFFQTRLTEESRDHTSFSVGFLGTYQYLVSPMGLKSSP